MLGASGCGSSASSTEAKSVAGAAPATLPTGPLPRFALSHWPWDGTRSTIEIFDDGDARVLNVYRSIDRQFLGVWKVRLTSSDARALDELVNGLLGSAGTVHACPRPQGPEGASWVVRGYAAKTDCVGDFRVNGGGQECAKFEAMAVKLMQLGKLQCGFSACLRPEERESGKFSCALGHEGDACREPGNQDITIPARLLSSLRN
jgi:hypothetical protein